MVFKDPIKALIKICYTIEDEYGNEEEEEEEENDSDNE